MRQALRGYLIVIGMLTAVVSFAQNTNSGDLRGTVTDPTGAVLPGVTVTVQDIDKGVTHTYTTDGAGLYDTGSIVPDHYMVTFTLQGFETYVRGPITLQVDIETVNAQLKVGSAEQKVIVHTDIPLLTTESGAQEATLSSQTMAQLPQVGADWENFVILLPGASGAPENSSNSLNPGQVASINGNLPFESMLADGATTTLPMSQNADVTVFETTAEVKVSDTAFSAQYGVGDIIYNQITKGGTDQFHGAGYEYFPLQSRPSITAISAGPSAVLSCATRCSSTSTMTGPSITAVPPSASSRCRPRLCRAEISQLPVFPPFTIRQRRRSSPQVPIPILAHSIQGAR
jgi:hypothetical protein